MIHYGVTKTAQLSLARGRRNVAGSGVTVNSVRRADDFRRLCRDAEDDVAKPASRWRNWRKRLL